MMYYFFAFANILGIVKVGFEQNYTVVEDAGVLEVCVILTSNINCSLNPIVATIDGKIYSVLHSPSPT